MANVPVDDHAAAPFRSALGSFTLHAYEIDGLEHVALVHGDPRADGAPLVRVQSSCLTGTAFHAQLCDCRQQLDASMQLIVSVGGGIVLYLDQEGRGHGLIEKVAQLGLIAAGMDTVDAAVSRHRDADLRTYDAVVTILDGLLDGRVPIRLMTNNPLKLDRIRAAGMDVVQRVAIEVEPSEGNREYLRVKKHRMGHLLSLV